MNLNRIIISYIMALLLAVPACACGHFILQEHTPEQHSCCPDLQLETDHEDEEPCCCSSLKHQNYYIHSSSEISAPDAKELSADTPFANNLLELCKPSPGTKNNSPRPPPLISTAEPPKRIVHCTYRL